MKYKTASYLRASGSLLGLAGPGRPGAWERDCRNGSPAAGSEAIEMRAGPVGRLAGEVGQAEGAPRAQAKARQEAARKLAERTPATARCFLSRRNRQNVLIFERCGFAAKKAKKSKLKFETNAAAKPRRRRRARAAARVLF